MKRSLKMLTLAHNLNLFWKDCINQDQSTSYLERREEVDNETEMKFCKTERGKPCILEKGYTYTKHRVSQNTIQWQCVERNSCRAKGR